jgi:hypothetical protein
MSAPRRRRRWRRERPSPAAPARAPAEEQTPPPARAHWLPPDAEPLRLGSDEPGEAHEPAAWMPAGVRRFEPQTGAPAALPPPSRARRALPWALPVVVVAVAAVAIVLASGVVHAPW